jgi:GNAT superfamily N-acetyltransferase
MPAAAKKISRRSPGVLSVEQTRDLAQVEHILSATGMFAEGVQAPGGCYLCAYVGDDSVGVIGIEARVDAALLRSLMVAGPMRRRGIGAALVAAARTAGHTRGARTLYALAPDPDAERYLARFGFTEVAPANLISALSGTFLVDYLRKRPNELALHRIMSLDISNDGVILR